MAMNITRRIRKAEQKLSMDPEPVVVSVVHFGDGALPPEQRTGNILVCHIPYAQVRQKELSPLCRETKS